MSRRFSIPGRLILRQRARGFAGLEKWFVVSICGVWHAGQGVSDTVRVFGTEDREVAGPVIAPASRIFEYVVFQAKDILKLEFVKAEPESVSAYLPGMSSPLRTFFCLCADS